VGEYRWDVLLLELLEDQPGMGTLAAAFPTLKGDE
jgi:hypothetical protein